MGLALAAKKSNSRRRIFLITGDGELAEGSNWEAALAAAHYELDNLIIINDKNNLQLAGPTREIMNTDPLAEKWKAFGMTVTECQGNDMASVVALWKGCSRRVNLTSLLPTPPKAPVFPLSRGARNGTTGYRKATRLNWHWRN
ncbi:Transketolase [Raoultella terrigena]|uniref:Transketolase n=1 Tax=Raoultella terrigena TaxID=577 RepID=A0A4U9D8D8_RAOTE|nr:Transketolase [Raoultella terrigena]